MERLAIYPGSFDPVTNGHLDVIERALAIFDRVIVAVARASRKGALFTPQERMRLLREVLGDNSRLQIESFDGLLMEYARIKGAVTVIRGLRAVADFEYEFQMAVMNRRLEPTVDTVFLMTDQRNFYVSSSVVKEVAALGGDVSELVPGEVVQALAAKMSRSADQSPGSTS